MLIDEPKALSIRGVWAIAASGNGLQIETGCYQISHHGSTDFLPEYEHYPKLSVGPYGVCDSLEQIKQQCHELADPDRRFVITLTEVRKADQPPDYGWRWHKWGEYIGDHEITQEYLADEKDIERVFCFHIYEKIKS